MDREQHTPTNPKRRAPRLERVVRSLTIFGIGSGLISLLQIYDLFPLYRIELWAVLLGTVIGSLLAIPLSQLWDQESDRFDRGLDGFLFYGSVLGMPHMAHAIHRAVNTSLQR